jgi:hypothetical protein
VPIAEPVLCVKAIGGPFEFNIEVIPVEGVDSSNRASQLCCRVLPGNVDANG